MVVFLPPILGQVFGASEKDCTKYRSNHLIILSPKLHSDSNSLSTSCAWLVDRLLYNSSGFELKEFRADDGNGYETWVLTK